MSPQAIITASVCALIFLACNGVSDSGSATIDAASVNATVHSTDTVATVHEPDTVLTYGLRTADDAINYMESSPYAEKYAEGILPRMASDNLDYTERLLKSPYDYFIVVDKPSMHVVLYDRFGREQKAYKMACSKRYGTKHKRRDNRTPEGFFSAEGVYNSTDWLYTNDDGYTSPVKGQYGPRFIRLKTDVTRQVGIHGTCSPGALGRRASHGCIRIHNDNILELVSYVTVGMPIIVNPSELDQKVNREEGYTIPSINIGKPMHVQTPKPVEKPEISATSSDSIATETPEAEPIKPEPESNPETEAPTGPTQMPGNDPVSVPSEPELPD